MPIMKVFTLLLLACALAGCAAQTASSGRRAAFASAAPPKVSVPVASRNRKPAKKAHANREAAISLLRREGILYGKTQVLSADWGESTPVLLIILKHPTSVVSHWFVNAAANDYSGGNCKH